MVLSVNVPRFRFSSGPNQYDTMGFPLPWLDLHWQTGLVDLHIDPLLTITQTLLLSPLAALATFGCLRKTLRLIVLILATILGVGLILVMAFCLLVAYLILWAH